MDTFADYILNEQDLISKMEICYYLENKEKIFFDKSVVFKTEIARIFLNYMEIDVDKNLVLTACLLCNCKKVDNPQEIGKLHTYAKDGAEYLKTLGFEDRFCKICEEVNRYSNSNPREKESDILELVDQFGGMLLDREERIGFKVDEAEVLLEHRNLKDIYNRYINSFIEFVNEIEKIQIGEPILMGTLERLTKIHNESGDIKDFIKKVAYDFEPKIDELMGKERQRIEEEILDEDDFFEDSKRPLFSEETTRKIIGQIEKRKASITNVDNNTY